MTPEQQRIAIAEACGWEFAGGYPQKMAKNEKLGQPWQYMNGQHCSDGTILKGVPDYLSDLNAMHEAEKVLYDDRAKSERYAEFILDILEMPTPFIGTARCAFLTNHATAAQRAEALLKTIGKWEDRK